MRGSKRLLLAAVLATLAGACGRADRLLAPEAGQATAADAMPLPGNGAPTPLDDTPPPPPQADTTGRWGGGIGSGT